MKKNFKILPLALLLLPVIVNADTGTLQQQLCPGASGNDPGCIDISSPQALAQKAITILGYLRDIFWIVAIGIVFYAAYLYVLGGTNEANVKKARQVLTYAIIGMVLALVATSVPFLVTAILGGSSSSYTCGANNPNGTCPQGQSCLPSGNGSYYCGSPF